MQPIVLMIVLAAIVVVFLVAVVVLGLPIGGGSSVRQNIRTIRSAQASEGDELEREREDRSTINIEQVLDEEKPVQRNDNGKLTLRKKLKYAQLSQIPPFAFSMAQIVVSLLSFLTARMMFDAPLQIMALLVGPLLLNALLMWRVNSRFERFDADYPQFILSLVGLLKTGLNPVQALESAAESLEPHSLVKQEVELMLERLRLGVAEERSIGSFGEDVNHPEIELFVQALLLGRSVGGSLSDTLDRLAKQVRKRQFFRRSAAAAVGLQRGSIWFILAVLASLEVYLYFQWPETVTLTWTHPTGRQVGQAGLIGIILGLWWVRKVTEIKV